MQFDRSIGDEIQWKDGKALNIQVITKKLKHKKTGKIKRTTQKVSQPTFFDYFKSVTVPEKRDEEEDDDFDYESILTDIEIGQLLQAKVIPQAILYFTNQVQGNEVSLGLEDFLNMKFEDDDSKDSDYDPDCVD